MDVPLPDDQGPLGQDLSQTDSSMMGGMHMSPEVIKLMAQMQQGAFGDQRAFVQTTRGSWSQGEDYQLTDAVRQLGVKRWTDVAKLVRTRTGKQCRERWFNRLCPEVKHEPFEVWEDDIIIGKQKDIGNRWSVIARELPGRSPNSIKNRWYSGLKAGNETTAHMNLGVMGTDLMSGHSDMFQPNDMGMGMRTGPPNL